MEEKEIKINNSKLKIVQLDYISSQNEIRVNYKKSLRYQFILMTDPIGSSVYYWDLLDVKGKYKIKIKPGKYENAWVLVETRGIPNYIDQEYSLGDLKVILAFIGALNMDYSLEVVELLCHATKDSTVISGFYNSYGREDINDFKNLIITLIKDEFYYPKICDKSWPLSYKSYRYSVQKLITDLVEDKASLLIDPELIGTYENISDYRSKTENLIKDSWCPIIGLVGNQERANISLKYLTKTKINIPENEFGIEPGEKDYNTIKTICLLKDGKLNHSKLGIRISSKLSRKLKHLDIIKLDLIYKNDYLIDISNLPVISKDWLIGCSDLFLGRLEAKKRYSKTILEYLNYISPVEKDISREEKFLQSLGVYEGIYFPDRLFIKSSKESTNKNFVSIVKYYPGNSNIRKENYAEYSRTKNCKNDNIKSFLDSVDFTQNLDDLKSFWNNQYNKICNEIRERKFQLIMLKSGKFNNGVFIDLVSKKIELTPGSYLEVCWKFRN